MPTVLRIRGYRFHFYSDERTEPAHIHIRCGEGECKFWLESISLAKNRGLSPYQLREVEQLVFANQQLLLEKFYDFHRN